MLTLARVLPIMLPTGLIPTHHARNVLTHLILDQNGGCHRRRGGGGGGGRRWHLLGVLVPRRWSVWSHDHGHGIGMSSVSVDFWAWNNHGGLSCIHCFRTISRWVSHRTIPDNLSAFESRAKMMANTRDTQKTSRARKKEMNLIQRKKRSLSVL